MVVYAYTCILSCFGLFIMLKRKGVSGVIDVHSEEYILGQNIKKYRALKNWTQGCKNRHPSSICTLFEHHFHALKPHPNIARTLPAKSAGRAQVNISQFYLSQRGRRLQILSADFSGGL